MPTQLFQLLPWEGGINTALEASQIPNNQLTEADNVVFDTRGSRKKREGINFDWDSASNGSDSILGHHDFWYGSSSRTQRIIAVSSAKNFYAYNGGTRSTLTIDGSATAWSSDITDVSFLTINNICIIAADGTGNVMRKWAGGSNNVFNLGGTPPQASILREHLGRVWCNDKTNPDRLHYSTTANPEEWNGTGDSGAIDIGVGDGDPIGITAIFPTFQGDLFVAKKTKLYRIKGDAPENFQVSLVTSGLGCESHNSITPVDEGDMVFGSDRGFHSLATTAAYGDFEAYFLSKDIQKTFNIYFTKSRLKFVKAAYLSNLNSILVAVTDESVGTGSNNAVWLYNFESKAWYRWPNISCQSMAVVQDSDKKRVYFGTNTTRLAKSLNGTNYDINTSGTNTAIIFTVTTGLIFPDNQPFLIKGFKSFGLVYKPQGNHTISVEFKIDNFDPQPLTYTNITSTDLLGSTFILGSSTLGSDVTTAPYTLPVDGYGRGFQVSISQSGIDEEVEIQGFFVEYENAGTQQEVRVSS